MSTYFDSRKNYLKVFMQDERVINKPAILDSTFGEYYTEETITHNLGYRPLVRAWYEYNGTKWPMNGQKFYGNSQLYFYGDVPFMFYADDINETTVKFRAARQSGDGALTGTFTYWYKIYLDPSAGSQ